MPRASTNYLKQYMNNIDLNQIAVRTVYPPENNGYAQTDINILRTTAEYAPVRLDAIDAEIAVLEEKLRRLEDERMYVNQLVRISSEYYARKRSDNTDLVE